MRWHLGSITAEELLLLSEGKSQEEACAIVTERARIRKRAEEIVNKPIVEWPDFTMEWDEDPSCFHFSLDGVEEGALAGDAIGLVRVTLRNLDAVLQTHNLRTPDEVWSVGDAGKAARVIVHCMEGRKLSPVWVVPTAPGKVGLVGGNHRLAVARAKGAAQLPIIFHEHDREKLTPLFPELSIPA